MRSSSSRATKRKPTACEWKATEPSSQMSATSPRCDLCRRRKRCSLPSVSIGAPRLRTRSAKCTPAAYATCSKRWRPRHPASLGIATPLFLYISSTGVYGDAVGDWVDEDTPCLPLRDGGKACLAAEEALAAHPLGADSVVLRLAGIYGPGRIPRADALRKGEPIDAPAEGYLNLIHVDDAARTVLAVEQAVAPPRTYCVADGRPPLRRDYYAELARLFGAPAPRFVAPAADSPAAARAAADKRISNARLLREIGVEFQYPSYREGLAAIVRA